MIMMMKIVNDNMSRWNMYIFSKNIYIRKEFIRAKARLSEQSMILRYCEKLRSLVKDLSASVPILKREKIDQ